MKNLRFYAIAAALLVLSAGGGTVWAQVAQNQNRPLEKKIRLRVADAFPVGHYIAEYATRYWMDQVTQLTGGAVEFEYYPAEQLGKAKDSLALTLSGVTDVGYVVPSYVSDKMPLSAVAELPGGFPTSCAGVAAYWKLSKDGFLAQKEFTPNGVRVLFSFVLAPYQIAVKPKFQGLKDLEGLKLRSIGGAQDITVRKFKSVPVRMASPEIFESMSRGTIDGAIFPYASMVTYDLPVKYVSVGENFGTAAGHYMMSESRWKTLPAGVQKAMLEAGDATAKHACALFDKDVDAALDKLKQRQVTPVQLSLEEKRQLAAALVTVGAEWAEGLDKRGKPGTETLKAFREALPPAR